jgi:hypothetical protein
MRFLIHFGLFTLYMSITQAQRLQIRYQESDLGEEADQTGEQRRGRYHSNAFLRRMLEMTGMSTWKGFDDNGQLPAFGVSHEANRRALQAKKGAPGGNRYGIGKKYAKASKKSKGKGDPPPIPPPYPAPNQRPNPRPTPRPPTPTPPVVSPSVQPPSGLPPSVQPPTDGCRVLLNVDFLQFSAIPPALFNNPNDPNEQELGTRYVYNDALRDQETLDELLGSRVSGSCTRTQSRLGNDDIGLQLGRGHCQFTYTLFDGSDEITITATGDIVDSMGGVLAITGGTQSVLGAYGEIELIPVNLLPDGSFEVETGDVFLDPLFYLGDASIFVPC